MSEMNESRTIAVTGASGYIASWVVKKLLNHGHTVHGTVRSLTDSSKLTHLLKQGEIHPRKLYLFEADLLQGGFEEAFAGCDAVVHMAAPFRIGPIKNPEETLVHPSVQGTQRVLEAIERTESIKHVVHTSSILTAYGDAKEVQHWPDKKITSNHWNTRSSLKNQPYNYAKVEAEKLMWEAYEKQKRWKLTTLLPGFVMGPSLSKRKDSASIQFITDMMRGEMKMGVPALSYGFVDVRDAAESHIHALEVEHESGRYISVNQVMDLLEVGRLIQEVTEYTEYPLPKKYLPNWLVRIVGPLRGLSQHYLARNLGYRFAVDNEPIQNELHVHFRSIEETFRDMVIQMERDNLI